MSNYFVRSFKYLIYFSLLFSVVYLLLCLSGYSSVQPKEFFSFILKTENGIMTLSMLIAISFLYPLANKGKMEIGKLSMEEIEKRMGKCGYIKIKEIDQDTTLFRPEKITKRILLKFDDEITITLSENGTIFSGPRKALMKTAYQIERMRF